MMKRKAFVHGMGALLGAVVFGPALTACGGGDEESNATLADETLDAAARRRTGTTPTVSASTLDANEAEGLRYMREEEKLAHDVYVALFARWPRLTVFSNIAASETEHTEAVLTQLQRYGLADPAAGKPAGVFENAYLQALYDRLDHTQSVRERILAHGLTDPTVGKAAGAFVNAELQALYDTLVKKGEKSLIEALKVGCLIEEVDIKDLMDRKAEVIDEPDIVQVYDSLMCGSRNHLRAFNRTLDNKGGSYTSVVLGQPAFDAIADSGNESCGKA